MRSNLWVSLDLTGLLILLNMISFVLCQSSMELRKRDVEDIVQYDGQTTEAVSYPIHLNWSLDQFAVTRPSWVSVLFSSTITRLPATKSPQTSLPSTRPTTQSTSSTFTSTRTSSFSTARTTTTTTTTPVSTSTRSTSTTRYDRLPVTIVYDTNGNSFQTTRSTQVTPALHFGATLSSRTESQPNVHNDTLPVPLFLSTVLSLPNDEAPVTETQLLHSLEERLSQLYRLGQSRYSTALQNSTLSSSSPNFAENASASGTAILSLFESSSVQIAQLFLTNSLPNIPRNVTAIFSVRNGTNVLPAAEAAQRFALLTSEELAAVLQATTLQNITVLPGVDGGNGTLSNSTIVGPLGVVSASTSALTSWSMLAAVVALSTVAIVLMTMALVWLVLLIYVKCTKKPSKTGPQNVVVTTESNGVVYIPPPVSGQPLSVDQGIQTLVLPRRTTLSRVDYPPARLKNYPEQFPSSYNNHNTYYTNQAYDDLYEHQEEPLPASSQYVPVSRERPQSRQQVSRMDPPAKPPRMVNEPHRFRKISKSDRQHSWIATVHPENEIPSSTDKRVKLLSVVKTNRVDPLKLTNGSVLELQNIREGPFMSQQALPPPPRRFVQPAAESHIRTVSHQVERVERQDVDPQRTHRTRREDAQPDRSRIASPEEREEREERRVRDRGVDGETRRGPLRVPNPETMPERVRSPYERTVREIRQEVHMWQNAHTRHVR